MGDVLCVKMWDKNKASKKLFPMPQNRLLSRDRSLSFRVLKDLSNEAWGMLHG